MNRDDLAAISPSLLVSKGTKVACGVSLCLCSRELARGARVWVAL